MANLARLPRSNPPSPTPERPVAPTDPDPHWTEWLATARSSADAAAEVHARWRDRLARSGLLGAAVRDKGHADFVSKVDIEAQVAALAVIRERHPTHRILAEESADSGDPGSSSGGGGSAGTPTRTPLWIVDPLDGTTNFLHGHPMFCASVGLVVDGRPEVGAVTAVATGERWWGAPGEGAFRNGERIRVSGVEELRSALVGTGFPFKRLAELPRYLKEFGRVLPQCTGIRRGGSAALDLCYLAQGSLDAFWEGHLSSWDIAGGLAILAQAGGCWSRPDGRPLTVADGGPVLAANGPALRAELRERLAS